MKRYRKIVVLDSVIFYPEHRERLNEIAEEIVEYSTCTSEAEVLERVRGADCIISCWVDISNRVIDENPQLRTAAFWTHAFEHRIDKEYARQHDIFVPSIPDYGTDSVAELAFIGLLQLYENEDLDLSGGKRPRLREEAIAARIGDDVRKFKSNCRDNLRGTWVHEYIKTGTLRISSPEELPQDTLKGLTAGVLVTDGLREDLGRILGRAFRMNVVYAGGDLPHSLETAYRPADYLLKESQVIIFDSRTLPTPTLELAIGAARKSSVDVAKLRVQGHTLRQKRLGIIGLGRIGERVAQIAKDGFDMDVVYFSRRRREDLERKYGLRPETLDNVLAGSEVLSFHLPHVGAEGFVTNEMVRRIPRGTTVVNVSVGNIFADQGYVLSRFAKGDLNGYLDVYETLPPRSELRDRRGQLLATYRLGWRTKSTVGLKTHKLITKLREGLCR